MRRGLEKNQRRKKTGNRGRRHRRHRRRPLARCSTGNKLLPARLVFLREAVLLLRSELHLNFLRVAANRQRKPIHVFPCDVSLCVRLVLCKAHRVPAYFNTPDLRKKMKDQEAI